MLLAIVRHAKAEKDAPTGRDLDRALTDRGQRQAAYLAERFAAHSIRPDAIIASRAVRTRQTAAPIAAACGVDFDFDDRLLTDRQVSSAVELIQAQQSRRFLVLVGHNFQVSDLVLTLVRGLGRTPATAADSGQWDDIRELSTGQAVILETSKPGLVGGFRVADVWRLESE